MPPVNVGPRGLRMAMHNLHKGWGFEGNARLGGRTVGYIRLLIRGRTVYVDWAKSLDESRKGIATALMAWMFAHLPVSPRPLRLSLVPVSFAGARFTARLVAQQAILGLPRVVWTDPRAAGYDWHDGKLPYPGRAALARIIGSKPGPLPHR